jgi:hypothetical protein
MEYHLAFAIPGVFVFPLLFAWCRLSDLHPYHPNHDMAASMRSRRDIRLHPSPAPTRPHLPIRFRNYLICLWFPGGTLIIKVCAAKPNEV